MKNIVIAICIFLLSSLLYSATNEFDITGLWELIKSEPAQSLPNDKVLTQKDIYNVLTLKKESSRILFQKTGDWIEYELSKETDSGVYLIQKDKIYLGSDKSGHIFYQLKKIDQKTIELTDAKGKYTYKKLKEANEVKTDRKPNSYEMLYKKNIIGEWKVAEKFSKGKKHIIAPGSKAEILQFSSQGFYIEHNGFLASTRVAEYVIEDETLYLNEHLGPQKYKIIKLDDQKLILQEDRYFDKYTYLKINSTDLSNDQRIKAMAKYMESAQISRSASNIFHLSTAIELYRFENKHYPDVEVDKLAGEVNRYNRGSILFDAWFQKLVYKPIDSGRSYILISKGPNKKLDYDFKNLETIADDIVMIDSYFQSEHAWMSGGTSWVDASQDPKYLTATRYYMIEKNINSYYSRYGKYPESGIQNLIRSLGNLADKERYVDGWGNYFVYETTERYYKLLSMGSDGKLDIDESGDDLDFVKCMDIFQEILEKERKARK